MFKIISKVLNNKYFLTVEAAVIFAFTVVAVNSGNAFNSAFWGITSGIEIAALIARYIAYRNHKKFQDEVKKVIEIITEDEDKKE